LPVGDLIGLPVGDPVATVGGSDQMVSVGDVVGLRVSGFIGYPVGDSVGLPVGLEVGLSVGPAVGLPVRLDVGLLVGSSDAGKAGLTLGHSPNSQLLLGSRLRKTPPGHSKTSMAQKTGGHS